MASRPEPSRIALIFDFDDTLAPDSTSSYLESRGIDVPKFWARHKTLLKAGWDPIPGYLDMMLRESRLRQPGERFTRGSFKDFGRHLKPREGLTGFLSRIEEVAKNTDESAEVFFFIISSGIGDIIREFGQSDRFSSISACDFSYNELEEIDGIKRVVSFTDKTRFIFEIQKGLFRSAEHDPFAVNKKVADSELFVDFRNMIMVGDGYTDVPCFSLIEKNGGTAIGVYDREESEKWGKAWGLLGERRVKQMVAADFRKDRGLDDAITLAVRSILKFGQYR